MNPFWREILTADVALHVVLCGALTALLALSGAASTWTDAALIAGLFLYAREVTQVQTRRRLPFHRGWLLDWHHTAEWLVPFLVVFVPVRACQ